MLMLILVVLYVGLKISIIRILINLEIKIWKFGKLVILDLDPLKVVGN